MIRLRTALLCSAALLTVFNFLSRPAYAQNFTGHWHRQHDNVTWVITENNGRVTGTLEASNFAHILNATKPSSWRATGPVRRINRTNGCETVMSYEMNMIDPQRIRIQVTGTDGRCDIPSDYTEDFVWNRR